MSENEELTKLVDAVYKNILDKFNPSARQLISSGKAYLKAMHGASAASKVYVDALVRLARNAQQGTWGGASDIGAALMQVVEGHKEIQAQQLNLLKAFYVDLLVPLESNLEKDTKVVQAEQKKFLQQQKVRQESYTKASGAVKKLRKKARRNAIDKEIKVLQALEEEKCRLDSFCEQSLRNAITQERRRYGFVLERQCSLAKHHLVYHIKGQKFVQTRIDHWQEVAKTREELPECVECMFPSRSPREDGIYSVPLGDTDDRGSTGSSSLRKTKSMDSSCLDLRSVHEVPVVHPLTRAKSDFNLTSSHQSLAADRNLREGSFQHFSLESGPDWWCTAADIPSRPRSRAIADDSLKRSLVRALYSYLSSGDHQLSFHEGDHIALIGERNKGWQYGENLRNHRCGWFPIAYTEPVPLEEQEDLSSSPAHHLRFHSVDYSGSGKPHPREVPSDRRPLSMFVEGALSRASSIGKSSDKSGSSSGQEELRSRSPPPPPPPLPSSTSSTACDESADSVTPEMTLRRVCRSFTSPGPLLSVNLLVEPTVTNNGVSLNNSDDSGIGVENAAMPPPLPDCSGCDKPSISRLQTNARQMMPASHPPIIPE